MSKYSYEEKLDAVLRVVEDGMSYNASARITGTAKEHVRRWVMRYKQFGPEGLIVKHRSYNGAFKISVIEYMHANHLSLSQEWDESRETDWEQFAGKTSISTTELIDKSIPPFTGILYNLSNI